MKKDGILILGLGETNGFFQRNLQRYILYSLSKNKDEIIKFAKLFFSENLKRAKKYGGRTVSQIIYDTHINPRIDTLSFNEIKKLFKNNRLNIYSSDEDNFSHRESDLFENYYYSMKQKKNENKGNLLEQTFLLNILINFSSLETFSKLKNRNNTILKKISYIQNKLTKLIKNQTLKRTKVLNVYGLLKSYKKTVSQLKKIEIIDKERTLAFLDEVSDIFNILNSKIDKINKIKKLNIAIKKNKLLFKGRNGKGMNYFVGIKV